MRYFRLLALLLGLHLLAASAVAQSVQFDQTAVLYSTTYGRGVNYRSGRGVPLSSTLGNPTGSDGRAPAIGTTNQFRGVVIYGAVTRPVTASGSTISGTYAANAVTLKLSRGTNAAGVVLVILRSAQVGAPNLSRAVSFLFGGIITPPATTEAGTPAAAGYWRAEPFTTSGHAGAGYYWSPHAGAVFAAQAGPLYITWRKATPDTSPAGSFIEDGGLKYLLTNASYVISGSAAKPTRKLYWTEGTFRATGKPVTVPAARISAVMVAYNNAMPERVTTEYVAPGQSFITPQTNMLQELRTLWYDQQQGQIFAYNREGRAFLELLGDSTGGETRRHLGYEIVDVIQQPTPTDLTTELGEKITAYADGSSDAALTAEPLQGQAAQPFLYRQAINGSDRTEYYAARATVNQNDALVHWLEAGVQGLRWPFIYARYQLVWPADVAKYSHYVRPLVATETEAKLTAVALPTENVPVIQYQDPLDYPRGKLSETFAYYTFLEASQPVHRALLRFTAGDRVAFERVFSWLDVNLKSPSDLLAPTLATNLTGWNVASAFTAGDIRNLPSFAAKLTAAADSVSAYLKSRLSAGTLTALGNYNTTPNAANTTALQTGLVTDLNTILNSTSVGAVWTARDSTRNWNALASSADGTTLVAGVFGGPLYTSIDSGVTWTAQAGAGSRDWQGVASSADGTKLVAVVLNGSIYTSANSGVTWTASVNTPVRYYSSVSCSADGLTLVAVEHSVGDTFVSKDSGVTWSTNSSFRTHWVSVASSSDGLKFAAVETSSGAGGTIGKMLTSIDSGTSWTAQTSAGNRDWRSVASSADGSKLVAVVNGGQIYTSTDSGVTWTARMTDANRNWYCVASSSDGLALVAGINGGQLYTSTDGGTNWTARLTGSTGVWKSVASSADGTKLMAGWSGGQLYTSVDFGGSFQANRLALESAYPVEIFHGQSLVGTGTASSPRVISQTANVGDRIVAPTDETGVNLAGYILQTNGNSFHPGAYIDPFASGFGAAQLGAIIPVNAIPGRSNLDVWWFRPSSTNAASSGVKTAVNGFKPIYWPAVIGRYTLNWPSAPSEIVLASNDGSGKLLSLQAKGTIYTQNDPTLPGYNPNEEHALMLDGQAYALRDDLNVTNATTPAVLAGAGVTYSSQPFVLLDYTESDGRPAMRAFKVLREKPTAGIVFDYIVQAGANQSDKSGSKPLQAPMPLPFLPQPVAYVTNGVGASATITKTNYNTEPSANSGDLPVNWANADQMKYANYKSFTYRDRKDQFWVLRGVHAGLPALAAGRFTGAANASTISFTTALSNATAVVGQPFTNTFHVSRPAGSLVMTLAPASPALPNGLQINGLTLTGTSTVASASATYSFVITDSGDSTSVTNTLPLTVAASGPAAAQAPLEITSVNQYAASANVTYTARPPFLAVAPTSANSFTMRFYYKTQDGFAWPGDTTPPAVGSIVPYLRPVGSAADPGTNTTPALDIVYRPVWPGDPPKLQFGETLMAANAGRPAVRGQTSVKLLYQQAIAQAITASQPQPAVVLHDPTREKSYALETTSTLGLDKLPDGVKTDFYQGRTYFPNLPPHLAKRFYFDPNKGAKGALVFKGEYQEQGFSKHDWVLLNVLSGDDLASVKGLCPGGDAAKSKWDAAIASLATSVETFYENPKVPGQFITNGSPTINLIGTLTEITDDDTAVDSYALSASGPGQGYVTMIVGNGGAFTAAEEPVSVYVLRVTGSLFPGELKIIPNENPLSELVSFQHNADLAGRFDDYEYEWKINPPVDGTYPATNATMSLYQALTSGPGTNRYTMGGSGIQGLVDNYVVMRYRPNKSSHPLYVAKVANQWPQAGWSDWTDPQLAEGWIKRVLAKINPFNQRVTDLYNNSVNTDASILTSAGKRWEGDIALNMDTINNYGLIEIYETILRRGRGLSIDAGINFGPANDALLLAAGYLNDLYMLVGNEAYADAANPTIGIGTKDQTYGDIATALFAFKGQVPSLLEEELGLLRGRDDFLQPGVDTGPVYNRFVWNYTRGIDAGEVIYALNYNILDQNTDGKVDAADSAKLYPQGHGDAYGHYLTAVKGYYSLLMNNKFDWVPRTEAVTILGKAVQVDYLDERKFAAAASAVARTGRQVFDLTWRRDYQAGQNTGWEYLGATRTNTSRPVVNGVVREWGADQWATRTGQGSFLNWVVGNAILPDVDPDPSHEGIQKIDRITVPELKELAATGGDLQTALDNAEGQLTPLGLAPGSLAFDINPNQVTGTDPQTHFDQIYSRAKVALNNAVVSFDDAKDVTRLMRSEEDSLADFAAGVAKQELAYTNALIELYGTPYTDDIGVGKSYKQDYAGPDLVHFAYVDLPELVFGGSQQPVTVRIDIQALPSDWTGKLYEDFNFVKKADDPAYSSTNYTNYIELTLGSHGYYSKPGEWTGRRASPGKIQQGISEFIAAHTAYASALADAESAKAGLDRAIRAFEAKKTQMTTSLGQQQLADDLNDQITGAQSTYDVLSKDLGIAQAVITTVKDAIVEGIPGNLIFGLANGGDVLSPARLAAVTTHGIAEAALLAADGIRFRMTQSEIRNKQGQLLALAKRMGDAQLSQDLKDSVSELGQMFGEVGGQVGGLVEKCRALDDADRKVRSLMAQGNRLQAEREIFRQRAAAVIQGFRTRDAAFRIFRNEKLERYKSLFDLASRFAYLAANAYDYETGLLGTDTGKSFVNRIINSRALGVVKNGEPQYAGSNTGDPGLSSALAEMKADWDVLKGRLGFNNPDAYGTTVSLRTEQLRILPGSDGSQNWQDVLQQSRVDNLLADSDVRRYCLQIDPGTGLPVPGIVLTFSTTIAPGQNLFGQPLAAGDSTFNRSTFATKLFAVGVALEGYRGMNNPAANGTIISYANGTSPADPSLSYLDPKALAATPYVYLIPVGVDSMRSPPLGDTSAVRSWSVNDVTIPLPFNIGASDFSTKALYQSSDSLTEPLFGLRKHQAFRPVSSTTAFSPDIYGLGGSLQPSQFTNRRLIGRSVWNSKWKLVIPGDALLNDPKEGLDRFIQTVTDVKLHLITYGYSGN